MSEYATFLKVGATSILLRMLEDPATVLRDLTLENPIRAIREISHDITCRRQVRLANGREVSALDIQCEYLQRALRYRDRHGLSPQEDRALDMWEHCLKGLETDPLSLDRECDWVAKYQLIEALPGAPRPAAGTSQRWRCSTCSTTTSTAAGASTTGCRRHDQRRPDRATTRTSPRP